MSNLGEPRNWIDRLVGAALGVLVAVVALKLALDIVRPLLPWIVGSLVLVAFLAGWRAWSRSRW
jgi:uncharacterized membrane protein YccC